MRMLLSASILTVFSLQAGMYPSRERFVTIQLLARHLTMIAYLTEYLAASLDLGTGHQLVGSGQEGLVRSPSLSNMTHSYSAEMPRTTSMCNLAQARRLAERELNLESFWSRLYAFRQNHPRVAASIRR